MRCSFIDGIANKWHKIDIYLNIRALSLVRCPNGTKKVCILAGVSIKRYSNIDDHMGKGGISF